MPSVIEQNIRAVQERIAAACLRAGRSSAGVTLVAVTKGAAIPAIRTAYEAGVRHFGENRVQESARKIADLGPSMPSVTWHMVGHLQTNKVKTAADIFDIIHSIDSLRLAESLNANSRKRLPVLIQVNVAAETTKGGFGVPEADRAVAAIRGLPNLEVVGLMTIAPATTPEEARPVFRRLRRLRDDLGLEHLSMGMSGDFEVAVEEGATLVRIGRAIFGEG